MSQLNNGGKATLEQFESPYVLEQSIQATNIVFSDNAHVYVAILTYFLQRLAWLELEKLVRIL